MKKILACLVLVVLLESCATTTKSIQTSADVSTPPETVATLGTEPKVRVYLHGRRRGHVKVIPMEAYLAGVIGNEMSRRWPAEALKAQAVAARSYALYRLNEARASGRSFDVVTTQADQVFRTCDIKNNYLCSVVSETRGEVLQKNGKVLEAFYSSTCGGKSEGACSAGLSNDSPLSGGKKDGYCRLSPFRSWALDYSLEDIQAKLNKQGLSIQGLRSIHIGTKNISGYAKEIVYSDDHGSHSIPANSFRNMMGNMRVKSLLFTMKQDKHGHVWIFGNGFGHGVGMCQYGAKEMAVHHANYKTILGKYYPGVRVVKIY